MEQREDNPVAWNKLYMSVSFSSSGLRSNVTSSGKPSLMTLRRLAPGPTARTYSLFISWKTLSPSCDSPV